MPRPTDIYNRDAARFADRFESVPADEVHRNWSHLLPSHVSYVLDVGAGSGRDAAWLAERGHEVVAVEPSDGLREEGERRHPNPRIRWVGDALPGLDRVLEMDARFDVVLLSAVWMLLRTGDQRARSFRKLANLLKPGGLLVMSLRHGPPGGDVPMYPVDTDEVMGRARKHSLEPIYLADPRTPDRLGREGVYWTTHVFRLPDDGTGALPVLRHVIVNDDKSSTYKLGLLRVLVRIADGARGMVLARSDRHVTLPLGLVGLYWLKAYRPLVFPAGRSRPFLQRPDAALGFVKEGFTALRKRSPHDFRVGATFRGGDAEAVVRALRDICRTIRNMPAHFTTWPGTGDEPVFPVDGATVRVPRDLTVTLDRAFLTRFGTFQVPLHIWDAMARYACWIEPAILDTWTDLMRGYDERQGHTRPMDAYRNALQWLDPQRDTATVRRIVARRVERGDGVFCVWSGKRLREAFEIDHCLPFAHWPNNDLWNLLPAHASVNAKKGDRLPSAEVLHGARERIVEWWKGAYKGEASRRRFEEEALAALPMVGGGGERVMRMARLGLLAADGGAGMEDEWCNPGPVRFGDVFAAIDQQRGRIRTDQQLAEWDR